MVVPNEVAGGAFEEAHNDILLTFQRSSGMPDVRANSDAVLSLPLAQGGFGLTDPDIAIVAKWLVCAPLLARLPGLKELVNPLPPVKSRAVAWTKGLWNSMEKVWNRVRSGLADIVNLLKDDCVVRQSRRDSTQSGSPGRDKHELLLREAQSALKNAEKVLKFVDCSLRISLNALGSPKASSPQSRNSNTQSSSPMVAAYFSPVPKRASTPTARPGARSDRRGSLPSAAGS